jgi:peptide/nickel transport system substrate-binding protein
LFDQPEEELQMNYGNKKVSSLLQKAQFTPDPKVRAGILNKAEVAMVEDVPSIPMFVRPGFLINNKRVAGTVINPTNQGSTWNVEPWTVSAR